VKTKTVQQLEYSRPLDVHKWSDYPEVNGFVNQIWDEYLASEFIEPEGPGKRAKSPSKKQFKVLLLDLYVALKEDPELLIGLSLAKRFFKPNSRYNALHISFKIIDVVHYLKKVGLIGMKLGVKLGLSTRIWPTEKLQRLFQQSNFSPLLVRSHEDKEVIVLNDTELQPNGRLSDSGKPQEYSDEDYAEIPRMRKMLLRYNDLLRRSFIDLQNHEEPVYRRRFWNPKKRAWDEKAIVTGHHNKFVRRVFYRGSWQLGGRFHGGFWQQIDGDKREQIRINDFRTVELDFSGLHINIAYALEGLGPIDGDPYEVEPLFNVPASEQRAWVKALSLTAINVKSEDQIYPAFRQAQPTGSRAKRFRNVELRKLFDAFKRKHQAIQHYFCSDQGVRLMNIDGEIVARVLKYFTDRDEPILSIHDSFICREQCKEELTRVMNQTVSDMLAGFVIGIKANKEVADLSSVIQEGNINVTQAKDHYLNRPKDDRRCDGYLKRWEEHKSWLHMIENPFYEETSVRKL